MDQGRNYLGLILFFILFLINRQITFKLEAGVSTIILCQTFLLKKLAFVYPLKKWWSEKLCCSTRGPLGYPPLRKTLV